MLTRFEIAGGTFLPYPILPFPTTEKNNSPNSRVWHQMLRKTLTTNSNFLATSLATSLRQIHLHIPPRSLATTYFKLYTSFLISGLIHATGDYVLYHTFSQGGALRFFLLQAVGITFEDGVIAIASRLGYGGKKSNGVNLASKLIGYIWVFAWFTYSMPIWLDPQVHAGTVDERRNFSLIRVLSARFSKS
jgi:Membrane bound O-acyl transferase family